MIVTRGLGSTTLITKGYTGPLQQIVAFVEETTRRIFARGRSAKKRSEIYVNPIREIIVFVKLMIFNDDDEISLKEVKGIKHQTFDDKKHVVVNANMISNDTSSNEKIVVQATRIK